MEEPSLEKIIEKLKEVEIPRWKYVYEPAFSKNFLIVEISGLKFSIEKKSDGDKYFIYIETVDDKITNNYFIKHTFDKKNNSQKEMLKKFYETTLASLKEYKEKIIKERLDYFISE